MGKLNPSEIKMALGETPDWKMKGSTITRTFEFDDFAEAMKFVNRVAKLAEKANHHQDIDIRYSRVTLVLSTHDAGGLTAKDFDLAEKIDRS